MVSCPTTSVHLFTEQAYYFLLVMRFVTSWHAVVLSAEVRCSINKYNELRCRRSFLTDLK